jgi:hypothetical protein
MQNFPSILETLKVLLDKEYARRLQCWFSTPFFLLIRANRFRRWEKGLGIEEKAVLTATLLALQGESLLDSPTFLPTSTFPLFFHFDDVSNNNGEPTCSPSSSLDRKSLPFPALC